MKLDRDFKGVRAYLDGESDAQPDIDTLAVYLGQTTGYSPEFVEAYLTAEPEEAWPTDDAFDDFEARKTEA